MARHADILLRTQRFDFSQQSEEARLRTSGRCPSKGGDVPPLKPLNQRTYGMIASTLLVGAGRRRRVLQVLLADISTNDGRDGPPQSLRAHDFGLGHRVP